MNYYEAIRAVADAIEESGGGALPPLGKMLMTNANGKYEVYLMFPAHCLFVECESWVDGDGMKALVAKELEVLVQ
jgi:hypothetical protein